MNAFEVIQTVLACQSAAVSMCFDLPKSGALRVTHVERRPREMTTSFYGWGVSSQAEELPARLIIQGLTEQDTTFTIGINLEDHVVATGNWAMMAYQEHSDSSVAFAVGIFGLPSVVLTSPAWLATNIFFGVQKAATGMDRHVRAIYNKIAPQLMSEDAEELLLAFKNHHNGVEEAWCQKQIEIFYEKKHAERIAMMFENRKDSIFDGAFMVRLEAGVAEPEDAFKDVLDWQRRPVLDQKVRLHEWMGMTEQELNDWQSSKKTVTQLLEERLKTKQ